MRNPLNDDGYTSNDEQIADLKEALTSVVIAARGVIDNWSNNQLAQAVNNLDIETAPYVGD